MQYMHIIINKYFIIIINLKKHNKIIIYIIKKEFNQNVENHTG
jgi:hypothetical protein